MKDFSPRMKDFSPHIFRIQRYSIHDGPGIRTTLFFQGCPLACAWCHNPESQPMIRKRDFTPPDLVRTLVREIEKDLIYFDESGGGVTFSGGDPLCRPDLLMALLASCREREIHTCLDTSGYAPFDILEPAARAADMVLYDIKIMDEKRHEAFTGKSSGLILENLEKLSVRSIPVRLRFPLIPSMTDSLENIEAVIAFLENRTQYRDIHILPFHSTGAGKYLSMGKDNPTKEIRPPQASQVAAVARQFAARGFNTRIGG